MNKKGFVYTGRDIHMLLPASIILFYNIKAEKILFSIMQHCQHPHQHEGLQPSLHYELLTEKGLH